MAVADKIASYLERSSWIRAMFEAGAKLKAEKGAENVYDFSLGNPNLDPPPQFYEVLARLIQDHSPMIHGYMPNSGYPQVRAKVAAHLTKIHGVTLGMDEVIMTVGAAGGINAVLKTLLNPGGELLVPKPYFVEYDFYAENHGGVVSRVPCKDDFSLDVDAIAGAINEKTCAVLINNPNNPTGAVYDQKQVNDLAQALTQASQRLGRAVYLISDEPYREIVYEGTQVPSLFAAYPHSIVVTSFSKNLSLAGERIGYVAVHPEIEDKKLMLGGLVLANRILGSVNAPALMQRVVAELMDVTTDLTPYIVNRDLICQVLEEAGFEFTRPMGAFYVFPKSPVADDVAFVRKAQEENLLLVPGSGFMGPGHFRIAFCCAREVIERSAPAFKRVRAKF